MQLYGGFTDIKMSDDGDLVISNGDLDTVSGLDWLALEINKVCQTNNPEWYSYPNIGADIENFAGQPNTRNICRSLELQITDAISAQKIHFPGVLNVRCVPIDQNTVNIYITVDIAGTTNPISKLSFAFDKGHVTPIEVTSGGQAAPAPIQTPSRMAFNSRIK